MLRAYEPHGGGGGRRGSSGGDGGGVLVPWVSLMTLNGTLCCSSTS